MPSLFPQAMKANGFIFTSGSIGMDASNKIVEGGIKEHTVLPFISTLNTLQRSNNAQHQVLQNIKHVLEASDSSLDKVIKFNIFISDMDNFGAINEVYAQYFPGPHLPART